MNHNNEKLDKFYTNSNLAARLVADFFSAYDAQNALIVEPSAGNGAFALPIKKLGLPLLAIDLDPGKKWIKQADFLRDDILPNEQKIIVIGNPPFGFASNKAVKFFNEAAKKASVIAFIVPRTFRKISIKNKLHKNFHLLSDIDIPRFSFIKDGNPHDVPCAWQVWGWKNHERIPFPFPDISHLIKYTNKKEASFAFRRVGGRAGTVLPLYEAPSISSNYYMKEMTKGAKKVLEKIDWDKIRNSTAGVRSISKQEIALTLSKYF